MAELKRKPPAAEGSDFTLLQVMEHVRTGRVATGEPVKPYKWLEYASRQKTSTELNVERVMEGCTFKSVTSCVIGQ